MVFAFLPFSFLARWPTSVRWQVPRATTLGVPIHFQCPRFSIAPAGAQSPDEYSHRLTYVTTKRFPAVMTRLYALTPGRLRVSPSAPRPACPLCLAVRLAAGIHPSMHRNAGSSEFCLPAF